VELESALSLCGGAARWERLRELRVSGHALRKAGALAISHGAYALPNAPPEIVAAVRLNGVASHSSAAALHGFSLWQPSKVLHVTAASWHPPEPGVELHRARLLPSDVDTFRPMTSALRTATDCGRCLALVDAVVVLDSALHRGLVRMDALRAAAKAARGHGAAALRRAVRYANGLADSPLETVVRILATVLGGDVQIQVRIRGVGKVDIVLDGWLVIETDGFEFHSNRAAYREDRRRSNALVEHGTVLLRFTYEDVCEPLDVLEQIERVYRMGPPWVAHN
jgi:very-short-patch-repair endonuclease